MRLVENIISGLLKITDANRREYKGKLCGLLGHITGHFLSILLIRLLWAKAAVVTNNHMIHRPSASFATGAVGLLVWTRAATCTRKALVGNWANCRMGMISVILYSQIGYNLKLTDMQAALGLAQLKKLKSFLKTTRKFFNTLAIFQKYEQFLYCRRRCRGKPELFISGLS